MVFVIRLIDSCNLSCKMCRFLNRDLSFQKKMMSLEDLKKILSKLKGKSYMGMKISGIRLDGNREGTIYPDLAKAVKLVKNEGFFPILVTNGTLLSTNLSKELLENDINTINFSISGINNKTYKRFQGYNMPNSQLERVMINLKDFIKYKKENHKSCEVRVSMLLDEKLQMQANEYRKAIIFYKNMGVDSLLIGSEYPEKKMTVAVGNKGCLSMPIINVDGNVFPCCGGSENIIIGNILNDSFDNVFVHGTMIKRLKDVLLGNGSKRLPEECITCVYNGLPEKKQQTFYIREIDNVIIENNFETLQRLAKQNELYLYGYSNLLLNVIEDCKSIGIKISGIIDQDKTKWGWNETIGYNIIPPQSEAISPNSIFIICTHDLSSAVETLYMVDSKRIFAYAFFFEQHAKRYPVFSWLYTFTA